MRAMVLEAADRPLSSRDIPAPRPGPGQVLISVEACAVCRTDLHLLDGELPEIAYPVIPGHQVVGRVIEGGMPPFTRVGVPWLGYTCGECAYCKADKENLCDSAGFTGYTLPGGFAEQLTADARYCFPIAEGEHAVQVAPLLCAGLIGYRAMTLCAGARRIGLYGFGAAAHILAQVLRHQSRPFYAFTRTGDHRAQAAARALGARWAGSSDEPPPDELDAAIIFAPVGPLVPGGLAAVRKGGVVVCAGIHMSDIPAFPYALLWGERQLRSVANLTRRDAVEFLDLAARIPIRTHAEVFALEEANAALDALRRGAITGSAVLDISK